MNSVPIFSVSSMEWLDDAACQKLEVVDFFVQAGHVISEEVLNTCRACPVRVSCLQHAYNDSLNITGGYFGGLSPGQRREMNLADALVFIETDLVTTPRKDLNSSTDDYDEDPIVYS